MPLTTIAENRPVSLVVGWRDGRNIAGGKVELSRDTSDVLRDFLNRYVRQVNDSMTHRGFDYDAQNEREQYFAAAHDVIADDSSVFTFLKSPAAMGQVSAQDLPDKTLLFYALYVGARPANATIFFRKTNPMFLARSGTYLMWSGQRLDLVDEKLFKIDNKIDVVITPTEVLIFNKLNFERLFLDLDIAADALTAIAREITAGLNMAPGSVDTIATLAQRYAHYRRILRSIRSRGVLARASLDDIRREIARQGYDEGEFINGGRFTVNDGNADRALRLLNEDRYHGGLSGLWYDVDRKSVEARS